MRPSAAQVTGNSPLDRALAASEYRAGQATPVVWPRPVGALPRLEPCAVKVARTVLRGEKGSNPLLLLDLLPAHLILRLEAFL